MYAHIIALIDTHTHTHAHFHLATFFDISSLKGSSLKITSLPPSCPPHTPRSRPQSPSTLYVTSSRGCLSPSHPPVSQRAAKLAGDVMMETPQTCGRMALVKRNASSILQGFLLHCPGFCALFVFNFDCGCSGGKKDADKNSDWHYSAHIVGTVLENTICAKKTVFFFIFPRTSKASV